MINFKNLIFIIFVLHPWLVLGQINHGNIKKNIIGNNVYSITSDPLGIITDNKYHHNLFNGFTYKRIFGKHNIRVGFDYFIINDLENIKKDRDNLSDNVGNFKGGFFNLGYEFKFNSNKIQPYIILDFIGIISKNSGARYTETGILYEEYDFKNNLLGLAPGIGFEINIIKYFTVAFESNLELGYISNFEYGNPNNNIEFRFNPLRRLVVNFYF